MRLRQWRRDVAIWPEAERRLYEDRAHFPPFVRRLAGITAKVYESHE